MKRRKLLRGLLLLLILIFTSAAETALASGAILSLTTEYSADSNLNGILFNLQAVGGQSVEILSFDINLSYTIAGDGGPVTVQVYYREGGYEGYEHNAGAWTSAGAVAVTAMGKNKVTPLPVGGIILTAGKTYGIYMHAVTQGFFRYTYTYSDVLYQNDDLKLTGGSGQDSPAFSGTLASPRIWNGSVYYQVLKTPSIPETGDRRGSMLWIWMLTAGVVVLGIGVTAYLLRYRYRS